MKKKSIENYVRTTWRTDQKTYDKILIIAEENGRTVNKEIDRVIKRYIELYEVENGRLTINKN